MEVHHHSQNPSTGHAGKKFKHYFFEFFMLFLAVFCGFLAENFREHYVERHREKEYMVSLLDELKNDTTQCHIGIDIISSVRPLLDSGYINVKKIDLYNYKLIGKWNVPINTQGFEYSPMMQIIEQLKSSGNLRLIESRRIQNKILEYEAFVRSVFKLAHEGNRAARTKLFNLEDELCGYDEFNTQLNKDMNSLNKDVEAGTNQSYNMAVSTFNMPIIVKDPAKLNLLANCYVNLKAWNLAYIFSMSDAKKIATELIKMINSEYHLK